MVATLFLILFFLLSAIALADIRIGFSLILVCRLFIPSSVRIELGPLDTPFNNLLILVLFVALFIQYVHKSEDLERFNNKWFYKPFLIFFGAMLLLVPFSKELPLADTLKNYLQLLVTQFSYAFLAWFIYTKVDDIGSLTRVFIIVSILLTTYGVYCYLTLSNPYITLINASFAPDLDTLSFMERERGGLAGRIQGTMGHPLTWGGACMLLFYFFNQNISKIKRWVRLVLLGALGLNVLFSGSRAALLTVAIGLIYIFLMSSIRVKLKFAAYSVFSAFLVVFLLYQVPQLNKYREIFEATFMFWDTSNTGTQDIEGSSVEMRINQFYGSFDMIKDALLTGLGQGYTLSYSAKFGPHPVMKGFESIVFMGLVETGLIGMALWCFLFFSLFKQTSDLKGVLGRQFNTRIILLQSFFFAYVIFIIFTGLQGTLFLFLALYVIILKFLILKGRQATIAN